MKKFAVKILASIGVVALLAMLYAAGLGILVWIKKGKIHDKTIIEIDFANEISEHVPGSPIAKIAENTLVIREIVETLEAAAEDERVKGLVARIGGKPVGFAHIQEIRDAVTAFRAKGKTTVAWADTFGEFGPGNGAYYLATAFEKIYLQPSGDIGLTGLMMETGFARGALEKLGLEPRLDHRHEYKNAKNIFTETKYTEPHRESMKSLMGSLFGQIAGDIAKARNIGEDEIRALFDKGVFLGREAVDAKLVDKLAYRDAVYGDLKKKFGEDAKTLYLGNYRRRADLPSSEGDTIALIFGVGKVHRGGSNYNPLTGKMSMGSGTVTAAFRAAVRDENVKAIIFRINSPGGSYVASDSIWRETVRAREAGKPVIVSMSNFAASGGYFVSMNADKIVAQPGTITGSIGVMGGKIITSGFWEKLGITWDEVHSGKNADMWTGTRDYSPEQWKLFQKWLDRVYDDFTSKVAKGRGLSKGKILEIAKGRVWTGAEAKALGLVDELGGYTTALRLAKEAAGIPQDGEACLKVFPKKKTWKDYLFHKRPESSEENVRSVSVTGLEKIRPAARRLDRTGMTGNPGVLSIPDTELVW